MVHKSQPGDMGTAISDLPARGRCGVGVEASDDGWSPPDDTNRSPGSHHTSS